MIVVFESPVREVAFPEEIKIHKIHQNRAAAERVWEGHRYSFLAINLFVKNNSQILLTSITSHIAFSP
jgi:hypothetical protein